MKNILIGQDVWFFQQLPDNQNPGNTLEYGPIAGKITWANSQLVACLVLFQPNSPPTYVSDVPYWSPAKEEKKPLNYYADPEEILEHADRGHHGHDSQNIYDHYRKDIDGEWEQKQSYIAADPTDIYMPVGYGESFQYNKIFIPKGWKMVLYKPVTKGNI